MGTYYCNNHLQNNFNENNDTANDNSKTSIDIKCLIDILQKTLL